MKEKNLSLNLKKKKELRTIDGFQKKTSLSIIPTSENMSVKY